MAWLAPGIMLMAGLGQTAGAAFRIGYAGGLAFYLASLYWLLLIPVSFTPIVGWLGLALYLSLYPGVWVWLCWKMYPGARLSEPQRSQSGKIPDHAAAQKTALRDTGESANSRIPLELSAVLDWFLGTRWLQRLGWIVFCAAMWVGLEMILGRLFTGFPWLYLGVSQYRMLPVIQFASITGIYGVSFVLVWFSVSLASSVLVLIRRPAERWQTQRELLAPFLATLLLGGIGWQQIAHTPPAQPPFLKVALIQPSIPQTWIWDPKESSNRFQQLVQLSQEALTNHPDLLVWPEAALPSMLRFDEDVYTAVTNLVQKHKVWLVLGSDDGEVRQRGNGDLETNYFNSSFLINPEGEVLASYRKRQLVIFGEYIPFGRQFSFIEKLTGLGSFTPGDHPVTFSMPELHTKAAILICFEDVFPHVTRSSVEDDTDFLLNLTNNGWFDESAAQWQHAANAAFRAVENGLPLVRCANNGLTCWVDPHGHMEQVYFSASKNIYGVGYKIVEVPLLGGRSRKPTFYHQHGDLFGWCCLGFSGAILLMGLIRQRQARSRHGLERD